MQYTDNNLGTVLGLKVRSIFKKIFHYSFYNISLITSFGYFSKYYFESGWESPLELCKSDLWSSYFSSLSSLWIFKSSVLTALSFYERQMEVLPPLTRIWAPRSLLCGGILTPSATLPRFAILHFQYLHFLCGTIHSSSLTLISSETICILIWSLKVDTTSSEEILVSSACLP